AAVMEVDRHEIAAAGDALSKNVEGGVRDYAQMLRDDHTRNLDATRRLMGDAAGAGDAAHASAGGTDHGTDPATGAGTGADAAIRRGADAPRGPPPAGRESGRAGKAEGRAGATY